MIRTFTPLDLRAVFGTFPSGVVSIAALVDSVPVGMAASSFTSVSLDPPLVSVSFDNKSSTWPKLRQAGKLGISVLGEGQSTLCRQLASKGADRFAGVETVASEDGALFIDGAVSWFEVTLYAELEGGDHTVALLTVDGVRSFEDRPPLVFHNSKFRSLDQAG